MPGPLKGPGKFWNIDPIWGYILLILATNCAFWFALYFQFDQTFLTPFPLLRKTFWSPPSGNSKLFWPPSILPSPPHQSIYERSLKFLFCLSVSLRQIFLAWVKKEFKSGFLPEVSNCSDLVRRYQKEVKNFSYFKAENGKICRLRHIYSHLRVRTVAKRHLRSPMFTASFILVSCVKLP